jgi:hypothetical protein
MDSITPTQTAILIPTMVLHKSTMLIPMITQHKFCHEPLLLMMILEKKHRGKKSTAALLLFLHAFPDFPESLRGRGDGVSGGGVFLEVH